MLKGLLPRLLPAGTACRYHVFQGKQDLEKNLVKRLRFWRLPDSVFVVMRDQDSGDCSIIKQKLVGLCSEAGKGDVLVRVACRELESFYLGDLRAVENGIGLRGIASQQSKRKFCSPDDLGNPSEELAKLTKGVYQKVSGSRAIGSHLNLTTNRSRSFNILMTGIRRLIAAQ